MNKNYIQPQISVIHVDNADIICTSAPKNGRGKKAYPPYDRLTDEQQLAFYFRQNEFGYTYEEIKLIQRKYMYRTDI